MTNSSPSRVAQGSQLTSVEKFFADETPEQQELHRDIARRYARKGPTHGRRCASILGFRIRDLQAFFRSKYVETMPNDDPRALDHLIVLLHHVAYLGDPRALRACAARWAPWLMDAEYAAIIAEIECRPRRWRADSLAHRVGLDDATRTLLRITTIGANDITKAKRADRAKRKDAADHRARRMKAGATPHSESAERTAPWLVLGMSRRTYYRKHQNGTDGTNSSGAALICKGTTKECHGGPSRVSGDILDRAAADATPPSPAINTASTADVERVDPVTKTEILVPMREAATAARLERNSFDEEQNGTARLNAPSHLLERAA